MNNLSFLLKSAMVLVLCLAATSNAQQTGGKAGLRILSATPTGATQTSDQTHTIVVMFNKPMVALQAVPVDEGSGPLVFRPAIKGKYRWLGTSTLTFVPTDTLPFSTEYRAKIPADTRALDGSMLGDDYIWDFETTRPMLMRSLPRNKSNSVKLESRIFLQFNQPMDPARAKQYMILTKENSSGSEEVSFEVRFPARKELDEFGYDNLMKNVLLVVPDGKLEIQSVYTLQLKSGLPGAVGNIGMAGDESITFETYNKFRFMGLKEAGIRPDESLDLKFSNPVNQKELLRHLTFSPRVKISDRYSGGYYGRSKEVYVSLPFLPDTTYTLRIDRKTKDIFGNTLDTTEVRTFTTYSFSPHLYMAGGDGTIEAYGRLRYPIAVRNINSLRLTLAGIPVDSVIPYSTNINFKVPFTVDRVIRPRVKHNVSGHITFKANEPLRGRKFGFVAAGISDPVPMPDYFDASNVFLQITNLAITAKFSPENNLVWVTHLKNTGPVAGAEVQVRDNQNRILWSGKTDKDGLVSTPGWGVLGMKPRAWREPTVWIFAREGDDWAFTKDEEGTGIDPWRFGISYDWYPQYRTTEGIVFTDRGLYRAGEQVEVKGIFRQRIADVWQVRKGDTVLVTIADPMNEKMYSDSLRLSDYGSFDFSYKMKPGTHLGTYTVKVYAKKTGLEYGRYYWNEEDKPPADMTEISQGSFRVEAFRPAESEVDARFLQTSYISGGTVSATISARYLFGAPMRNDRVSWKLRAIPGSYTPPGHEGFDFGIGWWDTDRGVTLLNSADTNLDKHGMLSVTYPVNVGRLSGTQNLMLEATATSPSRRSVTGRAGTILHAGQFYIGVKQSNYFLQLGDTLRFDLITVRPDGGKTSNHQLKVDVIRRQWISVRKAGTDGRYYWESAKLDSILTSKNVASQTPALHETYVPKRAGYYLIKVSATDSLGNSITSGEDFYVTGSNYIAWERSDDDRIELVADRLSYKPGDIAHVMVKSPYEKARALITVERDGILGRWATALTGSAPEVAIPITEKSLPNIFVSAVLLQGRVAAESVKGEDIGRPSFKIGYVNLPVDAGTQHLNVNVSSDREEYHPGDSVSVNITTTDSKGTGRRTEVVISVADMGVLNLINYALPDPFRTFFGPRALSVVTSETIAHLVEQRSYGEKGEDSGGGGMSLSDVQMRGDFRYTAYWNGSILTDDKGRVSVKFKLPDNLTQFKVMAAAQTADSKFGTGSTTFRVNKELLLQPALPRFARVKDKFNAGVVVINYSKVKSMVKLLASVSSNVVMSGKDTVQFELEPGESREVRFDYVAPSKVGPATFNYKAMMGRFTDGVTVTIPVLLPRTRESAALFETTRDSANEVVVIPRNIYPDLGELQVTAASTALGGLENSVDYLLTYPYGCLEQRLSSVYPIILGEKMVRAFNLAALGGKDMRKVAQNVIDEIPKFLTGDGGLAYWKGDPFSYPYLTGYALVVLGKARERGYTVDQDLLKSLIDYSIGFLKRPKNLGNFPGNESCYQATRAIILYGLTLNGRPQPAVVEQLYNWRVKLPLFAKAFLLESVHRMVAGTKAMAGMESELVREFMNTAKVSSTTAHFEEQDWQGLTWVFSTNTRTTAIILQALLETGDRDPFLSKVVRWLMLEQKVGRWRSTQENVYVVAALSAYFDAFESETPDFKAQITIAGRKVLDGIFKGREFKTLTGTEKLTSFENEERLPIRIVKNGPGILYYGIRMNYYPMIDTISREEGIVVLKTISSIDGKPAAINRGGVYGLTAGTMYKVSLTVIVPQERNFVVVDDPLPAGTEPVNLTFQTESSYLAESMGGAESEYESMYWLGGFNHVEQKDDRVLLFANTLGAGVHHYAYLVRAATYGTFMMPSTHAEEMYTPDVFGGTVQHIVVVK